VSDLVDLRTIAPMQVWGEAVRARRLEGERITLAVVELAPGSVVPEHHHPQEQLGICIEGSLTFRVGEEVRELGPGGTWRIRSGVPHEATAGRDGAVVIDVFSPTRSDWDYPVSEPRQPVWPRD
jgi:quercetin dioxygenase-like cupin family protein